MTTIEGIFSPSSWDYPNNATKVLGIQAKAAIVSGNIIRLPPVAIMTP